MIGLLNFFDVHAVLPYVIGGTCLTVFLVVAAGRLSKMTAGMVLREPGLYGVTGRMGFGKSYLFALAAWWALRKSPPCCGKRDTGTHRAVWANFGLKGQDRYYENWPEVLSAPHGAMVLMDEAQIWWSSTDHAAPIEVRQWITQLRKNHITCLWASQDVSFVARWLRLLSFGIWECSKFKGGHRYTLVDPTQAGKQSKSQKTIARFRVKRKKRVMNLYDTLETVAASREWGTVAKDPE